MAAVRHPGERALETSLSQEQDDNSPPTARPPQPFYRHIYFWVLIGVALGVLFGVEFPSHGARPGLGEQMKPLADGFISLIKMLIAPIVFFTVVGGIANVGDLGKVGRVGIKALVYFEVFTTIAMFIALGAVHLMRPGAGVNYKPSAGEIHKVATYSEAAGHQSSRQLYPPHHPANLCQRLLGGRDPAGPAGLHTTGHRAYAHGQPRKAFERYDPSPGGSVLRHRRHGRRLAPLAAFGAMASTVGTAGLQALFALVKMMSVFYATCLVFIFGVLGLVARAFGFNILKYLAYIKDEFLLVLGTSSSELALPPMMAKLEQAGCARSVVGIVLPAGYSFNLDGTSIYLAMAVVSWRRRPIPRSRSARSWA